MKEKIERFEIKAQDGFYRNIEVNGKLHIFTIYNSVDDVIDYLDKKYELDRFDKHEIRMMW